MNQANASIVLGSGGFADADPDRDGVPAAWRRALAGRDAETAARSARNDFAIGLRLDERRTFLAVDRFAVRTLCWRADAGSLRFAARADELAGPNPELDLQALYDYLYFHVIPSPRTIFRHVRRLPPSHCVLHTEGGEVAPRRYWRPSFHEPRSASFGALREQFIELLQRAVRRCLDGSVPACFLSGGTDSSTVAAMIARVTGQAPSTYSIGFAAAGYDEMEYARIAARAFGTRHRERYVSPEDLITGIPALAAHYDQPFGISSAVPAYFCEARAREDGVSRLLAGDGGDELFGGNKRYAAQRLFAAYEALPRRLRESLIEPLADHPWMRGAPVLRKASRYVDHSRVPMPDRTQSYNLLEHCGPDRVLTAALLAQVERADPLAQQRAVWQESAGASLVNRMLAFDWRYTLAEADLPKVCGSSALAGVDVAFPLLDDELVAFSQGLPSDYKVRGLRLRWFFKEALRGILPSAIIRKKKHGFGLPFGVWVASHSGLRRFAADALGSLATRRIVQPPFVRALQTELLAIHPSFYGEMVWILVVLEHWLRSHAPDFRVLD